MYTNLFILHVLTCILNVLSIARLSSRSVGCPAKCSCEHVEGRLTADCSAANLTSLSGSLPPGVMSLKLDDNFLARVLNEEKYFAKKGASNLLELSLKNCRLKNINVGAFWDLKNLHKLALSHNKIAEIPEAEKLEDEQETQGLFYDLSSLKILDLSHNRLTQLPSHVFKGARQLLEVDLSFNHLTLITDDAFSDAPKLTRIYLQANFFYRIFPQPFVHLFNLKILNLWDNPYVCDCDLREFVKWQNDKYIAEPPICKAPSKREGKRWDQLRLDEFACPPEMSPQEIFPQVVKPGRAAQLSCLVKGDPQPVVNWQFYNSLVGGSKISLSSIANKIKIEDFFVNVPHTRRHNLTIFNISEADIGAYHCRAKNSAGEDYVVFHIELEKAVQESQMYNGTFTIPLRISESGDLIFIALMASASTMLIVVLSLAIVFYRRSRIRSDLGAMQINRPNGSAAVPYSSPAKISKKHKTSNGYGYHAVLDESTCYRQPTARGDVGNKGTKCEGSDGFSRIRDGSQRPALETTSNRQNTVKNGVGRQPRPMKPQRGGSAGNIYSATPPMTVKFEPMDHSTDELDGAGHFGATKTMTTRSRLSLDYGPFPDVKLSSPPVVRHESAQSSGYSTLPAKHPSMGGCSSVVEPRASKIRQNSTPKNEPSPTNKNKFSTLGGTVRFATDGPTDRTSLATMDDEECRMLLRETTI